MDTIIVFTAKDLDKTIEQGGSGNWKLNPARAKKCEYVLLTANSHHRQSAHPTGMHGDAFLLGRISGLSPDTYDDLQNLESNRWIIQFSEYAEVDIPKIWGGYQNPVKYADLSDLGIDPEQLEWNSFPTERIADQTLIGIPELTIKEAKIGVSKKLGISPDCIEIIIRA